MSACVWLRLFLGVTIWPSASKSMKVPFETPGPEVLQLPSWQHPLFPHLGPPRTASARTAAAHVCTAVEPVWQAHAGCPRSPVWETLGLSSHLLFQCDFFFFGCLLACRSSWARDQTCLTAVTQAATLSLQRWILHLLNYQGTPQCGFLKPEIRCLVEKTQTHSLRLQSLVSVLASVGPPQAGL